MPNHVTHKLLVIGPPARVEQWLAEMWSEADGVSVLDFNRAIPMPACLVGTVSGTSSDYGRALLRGEWQDVAAWLKRSQGIAVGSLEQCLTIIRERFPAFLVEGQKSLHALAETGYPSWYEWARASWGTKWNAYRSTVSERGRGFVFVTFETAWSVPRPVFAKWAELYPDLEFSWCALDEGYNFAEVGEAREGRLQTAERVPLVSAFDALLRGARGFASDEPQPTAAQARLWAPEHTGRGTVG